jgi:DNA-binding NarL/FixJ family response regulator
MIRVGIVEDNNVLRKSLINLFNDTEGMACVVSLSNLSNVVSEFNRETPDVVVMDIGLPNISGIEGVRTVKSNFPQIQIMMFTVFDDDDNIFDAISAGAVGYLLKKTPSSEIIDAIRHLNEGGVPMSPGIARKMLNYFQKKNKVILPDADLTVREKEVLMSLVDGLSYKKIADKYNVSFSTIRTHVENIYIKLHVHSKSQAVAKVLKR